ncbi:DNA (cytosine-5-)-methyltransferase [Mycoplasma bradburyae]|uniref:Cytosine-specific methyltransferase n=1 Tax=Mycoplasma bradburyae TaxID=2963128 RepID=A0AAW6HSZ3_9MOLU|nr:DNA (cytosine-5-)-methyltransferase [Mycoplasma bradburyae]MDC4182225.1 DNA (cytosine-5-)-methyltransferase [Mycoplasma bradburyae]MDC4183730.1 DNA (cytosine-5-)-methyltransferase [Mycoplasma bradburyae]MDC4184410.1 DNA (cytosine-5-)-methyltransferase [Mycoplasma bradburyae]UTS70050.1 DNA (cytosine-5-)-methyltransferase [Mycoplasma bradburyae]UTS70782.1 DNA (cytosine-5-)-methyltransferase [Mycoplasma bradburyae]
MAKIYLNKSSSLDSSRLIKEKREKLNMTQKELADAIGLNKYGDRDIRNWEKGESKPTSSELKAILSFPEEVIFKNPKNARYTMIDLFSGIGGTRLGFQLTNKVKSIFSSEIDKFAIKTYKANFGDQPFGDITKINNKDIPKHDILVAGFPCQAFSQAGKKLGFNDTRGTLFFEIARILEYRRPKAFLLENVKNLINHDKKKTFQVILKTLNELDYYVVHKVLKARDFGVPQNRERIYIVGFDKKQVHNYQEFTMPQPTNEETKLGDILEKNINDKYTLSDKLWDGHKRRKEEHKIKGNGFGYTTYSANDKYTNTLSSRYYKDGSEILIKQKNKNPRKITPREAARLQGFPEEFIIPVSDTQAYKQFGNSVCVRVINAIAKEILSILDQNNNKK